MTGAGFFHARMPGATHRHSGGFGRGEIHSGRRLSPLTENHLTHRKEARYHALKFSLI